MADRVFETWQRWQVRGEPVLVGYIARDQEGVGPGMVRMKNLLDVKNSREVYRAAIVETRLLEVLADLLARLNAAGVEVKREDLPLIYTGRWEFRWQDKHTTFDCSNVEARNAVTVAALEVVRKAAEASDEDGQRAYMLWCQLCKIPGAPYTPDLAAAAVEAAVRVRGGTR